MKRSVIIGLISIYIFLPGHDLNCEERWQEELEIQKERQPRIAEIFENIFFDTVVLNDPNGLVVLRFTYPGRGSYAYLAWSRTGDKNLEDLQGLFFVNNDGNERTGYPREGYEIDISEKATFLMECAPPSPAIESIYVEDIPFVPFSSRGDLWMNTWADDDNLYSGWGDGKGIYNDGDELIDCGIIQLKGKLPKVTGKEMCLRAPTESPPIDDKPSSLLFIDGRLYGHFHSPLMSPIIGYIAYSDDYGKTWERIGFWQRKKERTENYSPWRRYGRQFNSNFRCGFFINMGRNYELNRDGYVYMMGMKKEVDSDGGVYLARVPKKEILNYGAYTYFTGTEGDEPRWNESETLAAPLNGITEYGMGSAAYHPGIKRYLFLGGSNLYDAPEPWGPWTYAGHWKRTADEKWIGTYMPGIIAKDMGPDYFWFTASGGDGDSAKPGISYQLNLGKMKMGLRENRKDN